MERRVALQARIHVVLLTIVVLGGCGAVVVRPPGMVVRPAPAPVVQQDVALEDEGAPPAEYIVEGEDPVYYDEEPGVAFYPVFFGYPGSCFCYMPVRYIGNVWYGPGRAVIHNGHLPFYRAGPGHLNAWRESRGAFRGHVPVRGTMQRGPGGRMHAVPPSGGIHARPTNRPTVVPQQHVAPAAHQAPPQVHTPPAVQHTPPTPQAQRPQPQVQRPQPQVQKPQPQAQRPQPQPKPKPRAPAKKCPEGKSSC